MAAFKIPEAEFVLSCPNIQSAPKRPLPEIAFAGRSNVGKSSLINSLLNRKQLAHTARTPGKTQLLNYYLIGKNLCYFVDLPGYGYAKVSKAQKAEWGEYIEAYLRDAPRLRLVVLIIDIRHGATTLDMQMIEGLSILSRPWVAALTKSDKLNRSELNKAMHENRGKLVSLGAQAAIAYSSLTNDGREDLWGELMKD